MLSLVLNAVVAASGGEPGGFPCSSVKNCLNTTMYVNTSPLDCGLLSSAMPQSTPASVRAITQPVRRLAPFSSHNPSTNTSRTSLAFLLIPPHTSSRPYPNFTHKVAHPRPQPHHLAAAARHELAEPRVRDRGWCHQSRRHLLLHLSLPLQHPRVPGRRVERQVPARPMDAARGQADAGGVTGQMGQGRGGLHEHHAGPCKTWPLARVCKRREAKKPAPYAMLYCVLWCVLRCVLRCVADASSYIQMFPLLLPQVLRRGPGGGVGRQSGRP